MAEEMKNNIEAETKTETDIPSGVQVSIGVVKGVLKSENYEETKERIFALSTEGKLVYLPESEAPNELKTKRTLKELVGREVKFTDLYEKGGKKYVSYDEIYRSYRTDMKNGTVFRGTVVAADTTPYSKDASYDEDRSCLLVTHGNDVFYMKRKDVDLVAPGGSMRSYIGKSLSYVITEIGDDDRVYVSHKKLQEPLRDEVISRLSSGKAFDAVVVAVRQWGARLMCEGMLVLMRNKDFSTDYTKVNAIYHEGDKVKVKLVEVSPSKRIFVQPEEKYRTPVNTNFNLLKERMIVKGKVSSVTSFGVFVNIMPGIDVLCPINNALREPVADESVSVSIDKLIPEKHHVRGRILGYLKEESDSEEKEAE